MNTWEDLNTTNYLKYINNIISTRGQFNIDENTNYEVHHIIPRAFGGLPQKISHKTRHKNLVWLTLVEHFEAHKILALDNLDNYKAVYAFQMLSNAHGKQITAGDEYALLRNAFIEHDRKINTGKESSMKGKHYSQEFKKLVSEKTKAAMANPEIRQKISNSNKGRIPWNLGKEMSDDQKLKLSKIKTGKKLSESHKKNIGIAQIGKTISNETRKKISDSQSGINSKHNKPIICLETGIVYFNAKTAAEQTKCNHSNIIQVCRGKRKSTNGLHFKYYLIEEVSLNG